MNKCWLCGRDVPAVQFDIGGPYPIECDLCGSYTISEDACKSLGMPGQSFNVRWTWATRRNSQEGTPLTINNLRDLEASIVPPRGALDCIDAFLYSLQLRHDRASPDKYELFVPEIDYPLAFSKNPADFNWVIEKATNLHYIEKSIDPVRHTIKSPGFSSATMLYPYRLDLEGWRRLQQIGTQRPVLTQAFVAMSFGEEVRSVYEEAIKPALIETGYKGIRMDKQEFSGAILDQIIGDIRKSRFMIADLTQHKSGVYFEAGFALGLGLPIIWSCQADEHTNIHFDVSHFNCIIWKDVNDLRERLIARIEATVPLPSNMR